MNGGVRNDPTFYSLKLIILSDLFVSVSEDLQVKPVSWQDLIGADLASQVLPFAHIGVHVLFRSPPLSASMLTDSVDPALYPRWG